MRGQKKRNPAYDNPNKYRRKRRGRYSRRGYHPGSFGSTKIKEIPAPWSMEGKTKEEYFWDRWGEARCRYYIQPGHPRYDQAMASLKWAKANGKLSIKRITPLKTLTPSQAGL